MSWSRREIDITVELIKETAHEFYLHFYTFNSVDIVLVEGIFLFKKAVLGPIRSAYLDRMQF